MPKKWKIEDIDACYKQSLSLYCDGFDHASRQRIPKFIEKYRISRVKDAVAPWITGGKREPETEDSNEQMALDLGCGHGWFCFRLIDKWNFKGNIVGVDVSEYNISIFNDEIGKRNLGERISTKVANAEKLPFEDCSFHTVYSTEALEHMESPEKVFSEAVRVLKPGGKLILTTPSGPIHRFWRFCFWLPMKIKRLFIPEKTLDIQKIYDKPLSWMQIKKATKGKPLRLINYHKSVLLPHESYIQFFPTFMQRIILLKARFLEFFGPLTNWMGLHHIAMWRKKEKIN